MSISSDGASALTNFSNSPTQRNVDETREWEKSLGKSTIDRMRGLGRKTINWRHDTKGAAQPSQEALELVKTFFFDSWVPLKSFPKM